MAAYVISDVEFLDRALVENYRALAQAAIAKYGGRYLARGGTIEPVEEWLGAHQRHYRRVSHHGAGTRVVPLSRIRRGARGQSTRVAAPADLRRRGRAGIGRVGNLA
jgi:hypothetical protein